VVVIVGLASLRPKSMARGRIGGKLTLDLKLESGCTEGGDWPMGVVG
jgi:hypothetical protein